MQFGMVLVLVFYGAGLFLWQNVGLRIGWTMLPLFGMVYWWIKKGRDYRYSSDQIYYTPESLEERKVGIFERSHLPLVYSPIKNLTPSEVAVFYDDRVHFRDMMAELVDLARIGFLKIEKIDGDFLLIKNDKLDLDLRPYQKYLINSLFMVGMYSPGPTFLEKYFGNLKEAVKMSKKCVLMSKMKGELKSYFGTYSSLVYRWVSEKGWYDITWEDLRYLFSMIIGSLCLLPFLLLRMSADIPSQEWLWILLVVGVLLVCCVFIYFMPAKTAEGYRYYRQVKGLKYFLEKGKWRYEIAEKNLFVEEVFPLCMALGVVDSLAGEMENVGEGNKYLELYRWFEIS
jgi:hypothetical protein